MKKNIPILLTLLLLAGASLLRAQCYGVVALDASASAGSSGFPLAGNSTFTLTTTQPNDLILIAYDGWTGPGLGPVTVDGNPATLVITAITGNSGSSIIYAYSAPATGPHTIFCSPNGYSTGYYNNFAAAFYCIGGLTPLSIGSLSAVDTLIPCVTGGAITETVTTTVPNSAIYATCEVQEGQITAYPFTWTGATYLASTHTENGVDASDAYQSICVPGTFTVTATNSSQLNNGCGGQTMVLVDIPPTLAATCFEASLTKVNATCNQNNGSITISVSGGATPYTYTWSPNVSTSAQATGLTAGSYTISVQDATCRDTIMTVVLPSNVPQMIASVTANELCNGFCNGAAMAVVSNGVPPYTYLWAPTGGTTATATGLCAGTYTIATMDSNHCVNSIALTITQPPVLTATTTVTNVLCNGGNTGAATALPSGGTSPYTYAWTNGQTNATATGLIAGMYSVVVVDNNSCNASASVVVTQPSPINITLTGPNISCKSKLSVLNATVSGGVAPYQYSWSSGSTTTSATVLPAANTDYTFTVTDANGCTDTSNIALDLGPPLIASISGLPSVCSGNGITLCANVSGGIGAYTYSWAPVNQSSKCMTDYPTSTTTYTMHVLDICGGDTNIYKTILAKPLPKVNFETNFQQGCTPFCIQFHDLTTVASGAEISWLWSFGDGDSSNMQYPYYCYTSPGKYEVGLTVFTDSGCSATLTINNFITAFSSPVASFSVSPQPTTILAPKIQFSDESTDNYGPLLNWIWNFGDNANDANAANNVSYAENPTHTYSDTGTYCAQLIVMNDYGCTDTTSECLVIDPIFDLYIPSAFSPASNRNQVFEAKGSYVKTFEMYIYDRWGKQLFHSTDINDGWKGTDNGGSTVCQEDSYIYQVYATDSHNKKHTYQGFVTLLK